MKELPNPRPGYHWEPALVPLSASLPERGTAAAAPTSAQAEPGADRRAHARVATIMRTGTLRSPGGRTPCIIKDVSRAGALIAIQATPHVGTFVSLRIKGGCEAKGEVVRADGELVAIRFDREIDLRRLLGDGRRFLHRSRAALPPVEIRRPALLDDGTGAAHATVLRISQNGARISGLGRQPAAGTATLTLAGLAPVQARIARAADDRIDLVFERKIAFGALAAWLADQEPSVQLPDQNPRWSVAAILRPLRSILPGAAIVFLLLTVGAKLSPAEADPVPALVTESWQPDLARIESVDQAMQVVPGFIARQTGSREARIVNGIDAFVRARFVHGPAYIPLDQNWLIRGLATMFPTVAVPVRPDAILQHNHALCSQQTMVFQELLRRYGIHFASVRMSWPMHGGGDGHFALTARVDGVWRFYDADMEITRSGLPVGELLSGRAVPALYRNHPEMAVQIARAARSGGIDIAYVDAYPAPRGVMLQATTRWLSHYGWMLLAMAAVAVRFGGTAAASAKGLVPSRVPADFEAALAA